MRAQGAPIQSARVHGPPPIAESLSDWRVRADMIATAMDWAVESRQAHEGANGQEAVTRRILADAIRPPATVRNVPRVESVEARQATPISEAQSIDQRMYQMGLDRSDRRASPGRRERLRELSRGTKEEQFSPTNLLSRRRPQSSTAERPVWPAAAEFQEKAGRRAPS